MKLSEVEEQIVQGLAEGEFTSAEFLQMVFQVVSADVEVAEDLLNVSQTRQMKKALEHIARAYHIVNQVGA